MKVTLFGMGYVGCVTAACLADRGHDVTGIDVDATKVDIVNAGRSPIIEPELEGVIENGVHQKRLRAATRATNLGDVVLVCVGTPSNDNGSLGLGQLLKVLAEIAALVRVAPHPVVIAVRSTVLPGTIEDIVIPVLEKDSGKKNGPDFHVSMNPEFMRETTAVKDFAEPPFTIIGAQDDSARKAIESLYADVRAPIEHTTIREAEMIKYACNAFHATKVCFANEIGNLSKALGVDSHRVMQILCTDRKLNLSPYYLKPGFAFGGSCLPKDLRAILHRAKQEDVELPMLNALLESNRKQVELAYHLIRRTGKMSVGILGLSFKAGSDDLRESPIVSLVEMLIGKGYRLMIYDEEVSLARLQGANRRYIEQTIPHISSLMAPSAESVLKSTDVLVVAKNRADISEALQKSANGHVLIDLVRIFSENGNKPNFYEGICW